MVAPSPHGLPHHRYVWAQVGLDSPPVCKHRINGRVHRMPRVALSWKPDSHLVVRCEKQIRVNGQARTCGAWLWMWTQSGQRYLFVEVSLEELAEMQREQMNEDQIVAYLWREPTYQQGAA